MDSSIRDRVARALARHLRGERASFDPASRLDEDLGMDALDVALVALRFEREEREDFPLARLEAVRTVGDLEALVAAWLEAVDARRAGGGWIEAVRFVLRGPAPASAT